MKIELQNATVAAQHTRTELAEKEHECRQLYRTLADEEKKCTKTEKKVEGIQNEKDLMGADIVKKDEEISLLNDKLQLMRTALDRGVQSIFQTNEFHDLKSNVIGGNFLCIHFIFQPNISMLTASKISNS